MVLAVTIVIVEDALRAVRLQAAVAQVHRHIADVLRDPAIQRISLFAAVADAGGDLISERLQRRGHLGRRARLELVGAPHLRPVTIRAGHDVRAELPARRRPVLRRHRLAALVAPAPLCLAILHCRQVTALHAAAVYEHRQVGRRTQGDLGVLVLGEDVEGLPQAEIAGKYGVAWVRRTW